MLRWSRSEAREIRWQVEQLPTVLTLVAQRVRSGSTLRQAFAEVASDPTVAGIALRQAMVRADHGVPFREVLEQWARSLQHRDADLVRAVVAVGVDTGGALASTLDQTASSLRERSEIEREVRALSAQARASALVLTLAPVVFLIVCCLLDSAVASVVFGPGPGRLLVVVGVALDVAGWRWLRRIERSATT